MAGHNKWSKIKHKKAKTDAQKGKAFSKLSKLITLESKVSGGDVSAPGLKLAIEKAKEINMPSDNIKRAMDKAKTQDANALEAITYESYGPGGCGILIDVLTDNKNRTAAEIRHALTKNGFALAGTGAASWMFNRTGTEVEPTQTIELSAEDLTKLETLVDVLLDQDDVQDIHTNNV